MDDIEEFVDDRQKSWCLHCTCALAALDTNRDHVPSKCLLREPFPENLPIVKVCAKCNVGFALDEEYVVAFLSSVLAGSTDPSRQPIAVAKRALERSAKLRDRIARSKIEFSTRDGDVRWVWTPETDRINRVITKNACGHAFYEFGEPMLREPDRVWSAPLETLDAREREAFENIDMGSAWPEIGSRMMTRMMTGQDLDGAWLIVQNDIYRYAVFQDSGISVRSVLHEYLATEVCWSA